MIRTEHQTRWKIVAGAALMLVGTLAVVVAAAIVSQRIPGGAQVESFVNALLCVGGVSVLLWSIALRWLQLDASALGTRPEAGAWRGWLAGTVLGVSLAVGALLIAVLAGAYRIERVGGDGSWWLLVAIGALATAIHALFEEAAFRAGLVGILKERFPPVLAIVLPAVLFGVAHLENPGATVLGALNGVIVGVTFGFLYLAGARPSLALVAGLHFGWNEALYRMGIPVSGTVQPGASMVVKASDDLWSGFDFGLEASPATTIVFTLALIASYRLYRRRR